MRTANSSCKVHSATLNEQSSTTSVLCFDNEFLGILDTFNTHTVIHEVSSSIHIGVTASMWPSVCMMNCIRRISAVYCIPYASESVCLL